MAQKNALKHALEGFADALQERFSLPGQSSPEDQLKGPVESLLKTAGEALGRDIALTTEAHLSEEKVKPDMAVYVDSLVSGYIELKKPGLGADPNKLAGKHNKEQWEKLKSLPNLVYTDGQEWGLYRGGDRIGQRVRFQGDPSEDGAAAIDVTAMEAFEALLRNFLDWEPIVPHRPRELAAHLAPLARYLREEVTRALAVEGSAVSLLAEEWRQFFFPDASDAKFADAYAQTVTYALLLARLDGAGQLEPETAAKTLDTGNRLLARTLELLGQPEAQTELRVGFELLKRSLEALDPHEFLKSDPELWLYFYEDFLGAYDPKLRKDTGVYYTPPEVVELQVSLVTELLESRFGKKLGFADDGVVFLDPAVGTGTYLVSAVKQGLERVRERSGPGQVAARASQMAENMYGFETLVGPYAVAHLQLSQAIESEGGSLPAINNRRRLKIYLADTLESPNAAPPGGLDLTHMTLAREHEAAREVKKEGDILVCIGNPPYDREVSEKSEDERKGGWVRHGDREKGGARGEEQADRPILADFLEPARKAGAGVHLKNLYNDYVYFWRWALWRMFEQQDCGGVLTFITASSYLSGPGFIGVREVMRRTFDEVWIIDLGGDNLGTRKTPNVFNIQTPVAVAIGVRGKAADSGTPARVHYDRITGESREEKLKALEARAVFDAFDWLDCPSDWHKPFRPAGTGDFFEWPLLTDLFPWAHSGAQFKRSWPISETPEALRARWTSLVSAKRELRPELFRETDGWTIKRKVEESLPGYGQPSIYEAEPATPCPEILPYMFRSFDRQFALYDFRLGDRLRPQLFQVYGSYQLFFTTLLTVALGKGPALTVAAHLPDLHHFCGRGGKDVVPLWRDAAAAEPNVTAGLLDYLGATYGKPVSPEDLAGYVYALLGGQSYTRRFWNELETPGPRVPVTKDGELFFEAAALGRRLVWLHTYGDRFGDEDIPPGTAKCQDAIPSDPERYPEKFEYNPSAQEIRIGDGRIGPVASEVWDFEVSGLKVVQSWLGYRMKERAGKKSSELDDIRPERWTPRMTDELLELLWVLEATLAMEPELESVLDRVVAGPCFKVADLPQPSESERKAPRVEGILASENDLFAEVED